MSEESIALKEKINELKAKRVGHGYEYDKAIERANFYQSEMWKLDDLITAGELQLITLKHRQKKAQSLIASLFTTK